MTPVRDLALKVYESLTDQKVPEDLEHDQLVGYELPPNFCVTLTRTLRSCEDAWTLELWTSKKASETPKTRPVLTIFSGVHQMAAYDPKKGHSFQGDRWLAFTGSRHLNEEEHSRELVLLMAVAAIAYANLSHFQAWDIPELFWENS